MFEHFASQPDMESIMIDAIIVRAHSSALANVAVLKAGAVIPICTSGYMGSYGGVLFQ